MTTSDVPFRNQELAGWGNYPRRKCEVAEPCSVDDLRRIIADRDFPDFAPRGLGRAYGDSALNDSVIRLTRRNRFLSFDPDNGVIRCEAGVSLAEMIDVILPRGWFLPTTPGTKFVTLGGAVAADVHGKNHHRDGSLGVFVRHLSLLLASGEVMSCSPGQNSDVFWATIGGMGLTGLILDVELQLRRVETAFCRVSYTRTSCLDETLEKFAATNAVTDHSVAWIDCLSQGDALGRGVVMLGNDARHDELPTRCWHEPLTLPRRRRKSVPFFFPSFVLNRWTVKQFNRCYYARHRDSEKLVDFDRFFYPLDTINRWNRIYGKRGFIQYQALFPPESSRDGLTELLQRVASSGQASFLAVLKSSGAANLGWLSYLDPGHTLALDLPHSGRKLKKLVAELDDIVLRHHGRLYLAKDAMMESETFAAMYPRLGEFQALKRRLDPDCIFVTAQARRLGIV